VLGPKFQLNLTATQSLFRLSARRDVDQRATEFKVASLHFQTGGGIKLDGNRVAAVGNQMQFCLDSLPRHPASLDVLPERDSVVRRHQVLKLPSDEMMRRSAKQSRARKIDLLDVAVRIEGRVADRSKIKQIGIPHP